MLLTIDSSVNLRKEERATSTLRAAAVQLTATPDKARNLETADRLVRVAAADGATLVLLPEKWMVLGRGDDLQSGAEALDGPAVTWARDTARELSIDLVAGSVSERVADQDKLRNTSLHIGPDGEVRATYRKVHMFDVEVDGTAYRESEHEEAGDEAVLSITADGAELGLSVCYDVRFPELYRVLAVRGARILLVPAAFTLATTREHWATLVRARAIENQCFVVAANQYGALPAGLTAYGRSMIVDPWGTVIAQASDGEGVICAACEHELLDRVRAQVPSLAHRKPEAYELQEVGRPSGLISASRR
jgi:predicted amidohydrolase